MQEIIREELIHSFVRYLNRASEIYARISDYRPSKPIFNVEETLRQLPFEELKRRVEFAKREYESAIQAEVVLGAKFKSAQ